MKRFCSLTLLIFLGTISGLCQSAKNDATLSVSVLPLIGSSDAFGSGSNGMVLKPALGYYILEKTSIELSFSHATLDNIQIENIASYYNAYAVVPVVRNAFLNRHKVRFFAEMGLGLGAIKYNAADNDFRSDRHEELSGGLFVLGIGAGGNYYFNEKFGVEASVPYISAKNVTSDSVNNAYSGIGPTVGLTYKLN